MKVTTIIINYTNEFSGEIRRILSLFKKRFSNLQVMRESDLFLTLHY